MSKWNGKKFSVYTSDEKSALGLIKELGEQTNYNTDELEQVKISDSKKVSHQEMQETYKIDKDANFTGSWHGIKKPTASQEGLQATVDKIVEVDIPSINEQLVAKANESDLVVERNRINNLSRLGEGSTTGDAELIDGRSGVDGITYKNIGEAIRKQVQNGYNIAKNKPITDNITNELKDNVYYVHGQSFNNSPNTLEGVYSGIVKNITPNTKYLVQIYSLGGSELNTCSFYKENGDCIATDNFYNYRVVDTINKIVEFTAPNDASIMTYTNILTNKENDYCRNVLEKLNIEWLEVSNENLSSVLKENVDNISNPLVLDTTNKLTNNLINKYEMGYYLSVTGEKVTDSGMGTAYFNCIENNVYRMKVYSLTSIKDFLAVIYFWDSNNSLISPNSYNYIVYDNENMIIDITAPVGSVKGTLTYLDEKEYFVKQKGGKCSYDWLIINENNIDDTLKDKLTISSNATYGHSLNKPFSFQNKSIVFFGDSITQGVTSPSLALIDKPYGKLFAEKFSMEYTNRALSGTYITDTSTDSIYGRVMNWTTQKDFIVISGGVNDYYHNKPLGTYEDRTTDTFYGCLHLMCDKLKTTFPNSTVIFITPINVNKPSTVATKSINDYRNAIFEVATTYKHNVVDGSKIGFPSKIGSFANIMCSDGVHPTELGNDLYFKGLLSILC